MSTRGWIEQMLDEDNKAREQQNDTQEKLRERIALLEQENAALQAEVNNISVQMKQPYEQELSYLAMYLYITNVLNGVSDLAQIKKSAARCVQRFFDTRKKDAQELQDIVTKEHTEKAHLFSESEQAYLELINDFVQQRMQLIQSASDPSTISDLIDEMVDGFEKKISAYSSS